METNKNLEEVVETNENVEQQTPVAEETPVVEPAVEETPAAEAAPEAEVAPEAVEAPVAPFAPVAEEQPQQIPQQPAYQPAPQQPMYQQPMYQPAPQQPMYQQPMYQPAPQQPAYQQPMYQPTPQQPAYQQPMYQPAPQQPVYQPEPQVVAQPTKPALKHATNRGLLKMIFLSMLTFGLYPLVIYCRLADEINIVASRYDGRKTMPYMAMLICSPFTLGIASLVWINRFCSRIGNELKRRGIDYKFGAGMFWLWNVLGSFIIVGPYIFTHKLMKSMNLINKDYNERG